MLKFLLVITSLVWTALAVYTANSKALNDNENVQTLTEARKQGVRNLILDTHRSPLHAKRYTLHTFTKVQLSNKFWSDSVAVGDINHDGFPDIVVGPYWYEGPTFKVRHELYPATQEFRLKKPDGHEEVIAGFDGALGSGNTLSETDSQFTAIADFNHDGWQDVIVVGQLSDGAGRTFLSSRVLSWYENPGKEGLSSGKPWIRHIVADGVDNQTIDFVDLFGNGRPVLIAMSHGYAGYFMPDPDDAALPWAFHAISQQHPEFAWFTHGLGYGDINRDGRNDILHSDGWWEQPASLVDDPVWPYHPYPFHLGPGQIKQTFESGQNGRTYTNLFDMQPDGVPRLAAGTYGGSQLIVANVNGDELPDIVTSIAAHGYGLVWWEQFTDNTDPWSTIKFKRHIIIDRAPSQSKYGVEFSEMQAVAFVDVDGDGLKDIVTGKCFWRHGSGEKFAMDPESKSPAVLYWFKQVRNPDQSVEFVPYLIDDDSGAGNQIAVADVNGDGLPDVVVANKKGAFLFLQGVKNVTKQEWERAQPKIRFPNAGRPPSLQ